MPPKKMKREESAGTTETATTPLEAVPQTPRGFIEPFTDAITPKEKELARYHRTLLMMIGQDRSEPRMFWCIPLFVLGGSLLAIPSESTRRLTNFAEALTRNHGNHLRSIFMETFRGKDEFDLRDMQHEDDIIHLVELEEYRNTRSGMGHVRSIHEYLRELSLEVLVELTDMTLEQRDELDRMTRVESGAFTNKVIIRELRPRAREDGIDPDAIRARKEAAYERAKQNAERK